MKLNRKKKLGFLETAAASDLAFLLIIYFIVIAGFNINKGFLMNLPAKDSTRMILRDDLLRFEMDESGNIIHDERIVSITEAKSLVASAQNVNPNIAVILTIDPQARWQEVVSFVELAQQQKIDSFSFTMRKDLQ
jgi:biopolymer transport protein ExbD